MKDSQDRNWLLCIVLLAALLCVSNSGVSQTQARNFSQDTTWGVVVASYTVRAKATAEAAKLGTQGILAKVYSFSYGANNFNRVVVGAYADKEIARAGLAQLKEVLGRTGLWLTPLPVMDNLVKIQLSKPEKRDTIVIYHRDSVLLQDKLAALIQRKAKANIQDTAYVQKERIQLPKLAPGFISLADPDREGLVLAVLDSLKSKTMLSIDAYLDIYYAWDNTSNETRSRTFATTGFERNQLALNTAQITARITSDRFRNLVTLHMGGVRAQGWDSTTRSALLQQAYVGVRIGKGLWLDGGFFMTHIGGEAILPRDNWMSSLALVTFYEPFIQGGIRLSYDVSQKLQLQLHLLNGYNVFEDNNNDKSIGWLLTWQPNTYFNLFYSGIAGNERPRNTPAAFRHYHNLVGLFSPVKWLSVKLQGDMAVQATDVQGTGPTQVMKGGQASVLFKMSNHWNLALRGEYYDDRVRILTPGVWGSGATACLEYKPLSNMFFRAEGRYLTFWDYTPGFFERADGSFTNNRLDFTIGLAVWLK